MSAVVKSPIWLPIFLTEFLVIVIINVLTLMAFARNHRLRKRSTYLVINLTVADLLVGCLTSAAFLLSTDEEGVIWRNLITFAALVTFPFAAQSNLSLICLERLHATVFPFRHCLLGRWFYCRVITASWIISSVMGFVVAYLFTEGSYAAEFAYLLASFTLFNTLVLIISYSIVTINVQKSPHAQHLGTIAKEKKLTVTLFIVIGVSVLAMMPVTLYKFLPIEIQEKLASDRYQHVGYAIDVIYFTSSIVNPLVYAIRLREFRNTIRKLLAREEEAGLALASRTAQ
ncbi:adenosine receptor A2a-like [Stylophora pistillata]|uniref:adenosine receptor A2a-like n=1 Tax=Stylophora pistillata TaxID=50429 RepID=UPI000C04AB6F|nr:adenosine receptor A2a-like [Stylophora pistillata]